MATKTINTILNLKDNFSGKIKQTTNNTKQSSKQIKLLNNQVKAFKTNAVSSFSSIATKAAGMATGFVVAYAGFKQMSKFINDSVGEAKTLIEQETKLQTIMKNTKGVTDAQVNSLIAYANAQESVGIVGVDVQLAGAQQIATFQLQASTIKTLIPAMNDLLAQSKGLNTTTQDGVGVGNLFGKVMNGQTGALSKLGINFSIAQEQILKFGDESQKAATLAEVLKMNVGGVNAALAATDDGRIKQAELAIAGLKVEVGKVVLKLKADFAKFFVRYLPVIQNAVLFTFGVIKKGVNIAMPYLKILGTVAMSTFVSIKQWGMDAFTKIKQKIAENQPTIDKIKSAFSDMGEYASTLKDKLFWAFDQAKPAIEWMKTEGLPLVTDSIFAIINKATELYNYIKKNWAEFEPFIYGIAGALLFYKAAITTVSVATKIWTGVTTAITIAQAAFNGVLAISPLGWVAIAIGAVITAGILLYKNWDKIKEKTIGLWTSIKNVWGNIKSYVIGVVSGVSDWLGSFPIGQAFLTTITGVVDNVKRIFGGIITFFKSIFTGDWKGAWSGIVEVFKGQFGLIATYAKAPLNAVIGLVNTLIEKVNSVSINIPDWIPEFGGKSFGFNIPKIPNFALGTSYHKGGLARINERGGEILNLPNGTQVVPADKSAKMVNSSRGNITIHLNVHGNLIGEEEEVNRIMNKAIRKLEIQLGNV